MFAGAGFFFMYVFLDPMQRLKNSPTLSLSRSSFKGKSSHVAIEGILFFPFLNETFSATDSLKG